MCGISDLVLASLPPIELIGSKSNSTWDSAVTTLCSSPTLPTDRQIHLISLLVHSIQHKQEGGIKLPDINDNISPMGVESSKPNHLKLVELVELSEQKLTTIAFWPTLNYVHASVWQSII